MQLTPLKPQKYRETLLQKETLLTLKKFQDCKSAFSVQCSGINSLNFNTNITHNNLFSLSADIQTWYSLPDC